MPSHVGVPARVIVLRGEPRVQVMERGAWVDVGGPDDAEWLVENAWDQPDGTTILFGHVVQLPADWPAVASRSRKITVDWTDGRQ